MEIDARRKDSVKKWNCVRPRRRNSTVDLREKLWSLIGGEKREIFLTERRKNEKKMRGKKRKKPSRGEV